MSLLYAGALLYATVSWAAAAPLSADEVVRYALLHHPAPVAASAAIDAARARRAEIGVLSANPTVEAQLSASPSGAQYAQAVQPLSLTGEGWHARRAGALSIAAAEANAERTALVVAADARLAWAEATIALRKAALADELLSLAARLREIAVARAAAGEASTLERNLARVVEAHAVADALALRADAAAARTRLAAYHPGALDAELSEPEDSLPKGAPLGSAPRSDVEAAHLSTLSARSALLRARAAALPAVGLGGWASAQGGPVSFGPYIEAEIPLFTFGQGAAAEARAALREAEAVEEQVERIAAAESATSTALFAAARDDRARLVGVDEAAREALISIDRGFEAGEIDLATAVLLRTQVFDGWLASLDARAAVIDAELSAMLARSDAALLGGSP